MAKSSLFGRLLVAELFITLFWTTLSAQQLPKPTQNYRHTAVLESPDVFVLYWSIGDDDTITFEVHAKTSGWMGIGLNTKRGMLGADFAIGWIKDGVTCFQDRNGLRANAAPTIDSSQDWIMVGAKEQSGYTMMTVRRKLNTCDDQDVPITDDTIQVLYAYHDTEPSECQGELHYHGNRRGAVGLHLMNRAPPAPVLPSDVTDYTINSTLAVPSDVYSRRCTALKMRAFTKKHHVVKISPDHVTDSGLLRHLNVYACVTTVHQRLLDQDYDCNAPPSGLETAFCDELLFSWASGNEVFHYPEEAGFPLGDSQSKKYIMLEKYFHNPQRKSGVRDSAGLVLTLTSSIRRYDAGLMKVGHAYTENKKVTQIIPPGVASFTSYGVCVHQCLSETSPDKSFTVFATSFHAHSLANSLRLRHIRDGFEEPIISQDNYYDYRAPYVRHIQPAIVSPKDDLVLECTYDASKTTKLTLSGQQESNEECLSYLHYYPRINQLSNCLSAPKIQDVMGSLDIELKEIPRTPYYVVESPPAYARKGWLETLALVDWENTKNVRRLQNSARRSDILVHCFKDINSNINVDSTVVSPPPITQRIPTTYPPCEATSTAETNTKHGGAGTSFQFGSLPYFVFLSACLNFLLRF